MKIERTMTYDVAPDAVMQMSLDPAFQERKCADAGALTWNVRVFEEHGSQVISTRRKLPTSGFPGFLRKFMPEGITSTEIITWAPEAEADGTRTATLEVDFHGAPIALHGRIRVSPQDSSASLVDIRAEFKASVPLVGGKVEKMSEPIIVGVIDSEQQTGRAWLAAGAA